MSGHTPWAEIKHKRDLPPWRPNALWIHFTKFVHAWISFFEVLVAVLTFGVYWNMRAGFWWMGKTLEWEAKMRKRAGR